MHFLCLQHYYIGISFSSCRNKYNLCSVIQNRMNLSLWVLHPAAVSLLCISKYHPKVSSQSYIYRKKENNTKVQDRIYIIVQLWILCFMNCCMGLFINYIILDDDLYSIFMPEAAAFCPPVVLM